MTDGPGIKLWHPVLQYRVLGGESQFPMSLQDAVEGADPLNDVNDVVGYLRSAYVLAATTATVDDILNPTAKAVATHSLSTDGDWLWAEDIPYYVATYGMRLPEEFLAVIRGRAYLPPTLTEAQSGQLMRDFRGF